MSPRPRYDTDALWDDPTERQADRRDASRAKAHLSIKVAVRLKDKHQPLVGPGIADNISVSGLYCRSKHSLMPGQAVEIYMSLKDCPKEMGLPRAIVGPGRIVWAKPDGDKILGTAIRFDDELATDIHLALFVNYLDSLEKANTPPPRSIRTPYPERTPSEQRA